MDRLTPPQKQAVRLGFVGLLIIVVSLKVMLQWGEQYPAIPLNGQPAILFFTLGEPCDCMQDLVQQAEIQVGQWPEAQRAGLPVYRIVYEERQDLAAKYRITRVPGLALLDESEEVVYWQDCWQPEGDPFDLEAFEAHIRVPEE